MHGTSETTERSMDPAGHLLPNRAFTDLDRSPAPGLVRIVESALTSIERACQDDYLLCEEYPHGGGTGRPFFSPFVLACSVVLMVPLIRIHGVLGPWRPESRRLLERMVQRLTSTPHRDGRFNFFGDRLSECDLDTTAVVNLALLLTDGQTKLQADPFAVALDLWDPSFGAYKTWFDRTPNRVDWGVNSNFNLLLNTMGLRATWLEGYLARYEVKFLSCGSHYYPWSGLPVLLREAVKPGGRHKSTTPPMAEPAARMGLGKTCLRERRIYFRGNRGLFGSRLLDNVVDLCLLNRNSGDNLCRMG